VVDWPDMAKADRLESRKKPAKKPKQPEVKVTVETAKKGPYSATTRKKRSTATGKRKSVPRPRESVVETQISFRIQPALLAKVDGLVADLQRNYSGSQIASRGGVIRRCIDLGLDAVRAELAPLFRGKRVTSKHGPASVPASSADDSSGLQASHDLDSAIITNAEPSTKASD
jgi:hypothetical protein